MIESYANPDVWPAARQRSGAHALRSCYAAATPSLPEAPRLVEAQGIHAHNTGAELAQNVYLQILRRGAIIILCCFAVGGGIGLIRAWLEPPTYTSTSRSFVSTNTAANVSDLAQGSTFAQQIIRSYASVATTPLVLNTVISDLRLRDSAQSLANRISATVDLNTVVIDITASDSSPTQAAEIANAVAKRLATAAKELVPDAAGSTSIKITLLQPALPSAKPVSPDPVKYAATGALAGLLAGLLLAFVRAALDTRIRSAGELESASDATALGSIPLHTRNQTPLIVHNGAAEAKAEAYRGLAANLKFLDVDSAAKSIVFTSSVQGEGKSTTACNTAVAIAETEPSTLLMDCDLRRPRVAEYMGIDGAVGLTDVMVGAVDLEDALQAWGNNGLVVLPAGTRPPNSGEIIQSEKFRTLLGQLEQRFSVVIIDAPPVLAVSDAAVLSTVASGALLICASGRGRRAQVRAAVSALEHVRAKILGSALTMVSGRGSEAYSYSYGYEYATAEVTKTARSRTLARRPSPTD